MEFLSQKYLEAANDQLPHGWELEESSRIARSGAPTFSLRVVWKTPFKGTIHAWIVYVDQPRRVIRGLVDDVASRGLIALIDPAHGTYTSRVRVPGYLFETIGLREALVSADPSLKEVIKTEE